jgi:broad specificity phosphatase PhoE
LTDAVGHKITGRLPGVHLNQVGRQQALGLPDRLKSFNIAAIYSSPLERAMQTAEPVAASLSIPVRKSEALSEFDFGEWSGMALSELQQRDDWKMFNLFRSSTRAPGGELMTEVQTRVVTELDRLGREHDGNTVALFSHADAIKAVLMHFLGMPVDHIQRLYISPASISIVRLHAWGVQVWAMNMMPPEASTQQH